MICLEVKLFIAGYCVNPGKIAIADKSFRLQKFPAMAALIKHPEKGYILFDTGYTRRFFTETATWPLVIYRWVTPVYLKQGESVAEQLNSQGIHPDQIRYIIISHFHADHIGGCGDFPQAAFIAHSEAYNAVKHLEGLHALRAGFIKNLLPQDFEKRLILLSDSRLTNLPPEHCPFKHGFDIFEDGSLIAVKLTGHAPGQIGLIIPRSFAGSYFFVSDACWQKCSYSKLIFPHPLAKLVISCWEEYTQTIRQIHQYAVYHPEATVVPTHCSETLGTVQNKLDSSLGGVIGDSNYENTNTISSNKIRR